MVKIKGLIVIAEPSISKMGRDPYYALVDLLCEEYGFMRMELEEDSRIPDGLDLVINYSNTRDQILNLDRRTKLITWMGDVNIPPGTIEQTKERIERRKSLYQKSDVILSSAGFYFRRKYPQFTHKMIFFPKHYGYYKNFCDLKFNERPNMKCLLSGATSKDTYPLRAYVKKNINAELLVRPTRRYVGRGYAELLNSYFCCMTDSSIYRGVVGKYFEIPAAGSLLIANRTEDSDEAGFVSGTHYVEITKKEHVLHQIKDCLDYPVKYNRIRKAGMKFVRTFHGPSARFTKFKQVIEEVMG